MSSATPKIQFIQNHQTALDAGEYKVEITQTININNQPPKVKKTNGTEEDEKPFHSSLTFVIQGNRFELTPQDIHAVFPPENSLGDHAHVLPHIALKSSTLPWERLVHSDSPQEIPWLALLLLYDDEKPLRTIQREDFLNANFYDQEGKQISDKVKLWNYLLSKPISWLQSTVINSNSNAIIVEEAIIVEKESRKVPNLSNEFSVLDNQVEAFLAQSRSIKTLTLKQLEASSEGTIKWPGITREVGQLEKDQVTVIDLPRSLLSEILPTSQDMVYLAHVRQTTGGTESSEPLAVVVGNRLPKQGGTSTAYLVSLENRFEAGGNFDYKNARDEDYIRLVVLKSWNFSCSDPEQSFKGLLGKLNLLFQTILSDADINQLDKGTVPDNLKSEFRKHKPDLSGNLLISVSRTLTTTDSKQYSIRSNGDSLDIYSENTLLFNMILSDADRQELDRGTVPESLKSEFRKHKPDLSENFLIAHNWSIKDGNRHYPISINSNSSNKKQLSVFYDGTLVLPKPEQATLEAEQYLIKGYVPLRHYLRQGGKTFSWYHGPLLPGKNETNSSLSQLAVRCADQLIAYDENNGLFDVSYAAAWQLGKLLALQDKKLAINLFNWKRANAQKLAKDNQQALYPHLFPTDSQNIGDSISIPEDIATWFKQLALLSGVPFNYLVPDDKMLPPESIGFFWLDWFWIESLLDGAFSIGRVYESKPEVDKLPSQVKQITGCLIRSEVIAGWPDLQVTALEKDGSGSETKKLDLLRRDRLSQDVLICLFEGEVQTLEIFLKPEGLYFGFTSKITRELRSLDGKEQDSWEITSIPWKNADQKIVNIDQLASDISDMLKANGQKFNSFTSAQFALQMVQGAELVRFVRSYT